MSCTPMDQLHEYDFFTINARAPGFPELADQARRRAVELRAASYDAGNDVERDCLQAVYVYEEVLFAGKHDNMFD